MVVTLANIACVEAFNVVMYRNQDSACLPASLASWLTGGKSASTNEYRAIWRCCRPRYRRPSTSTYDPILARRSLFCKCTIYGQPQRGSCRGLRDRPSYWYASLDNMILRWTQSITMRLRCWTAIQLCRQSKHINKTFTLTFSRRLYQVACYWKEWRT